MYWYSRHLCSITQEGSIGQRRFICQAWCSVFKAFILNSLWGVHLPKYVHLPSFVYQYSRHLFLIHCWGSICQSRFIYQVLCTGIQGISALIPRRGPLAKEGSSAKFGVVYSKHLFSIHCGGPSAKVCSSAKFGVAVFKVSILSSLGGPLPK